MTALRLENPKLLDGQRSAYSYGRGGPVISGERPGSTIVEFAIGESKSYAWVITPEAIELKVLAGRVQVRNARFEPLRAAAGIDADSGDCRQLPGACTSSLRSY